MMIVIFIVVVGVVAMFVRAFFWPVVIILIAYSIYNFVAGNRKRDRGFNTYTQKDQQKRSSQDPRIKKDVIDVEYKEKDID